MTLHKLRSAAEKFRRWTNDPCRFSVSSSFLAWPGNNRRKAGKAVTLGLGRAPPAPGGGRGARPGEQHAVLILLCPLALTNFPLANRSFHRKARLQLFTSHALCPSTSLPMHQHAFSQDLSWPAKRMDSCSAQTCKWRGISLFALLPRNLFKTAFLLFMNATSSRSTD